MEPPAFFVPAATAENLEAVYADLAKFCGQPPQPSERRIYSITYVHNGETWTATVGKKLSGKGSRTKRIKGKNVEQSYGVSDPATVLAIFPGYPYMVVTNHRLAGNVGSAWENPFLAGQPKSVTYFEP